MRERGNETASSEREERLDRNNDVKRTENERARIFTRVENREKDKMKMRKRRKQVRLLYGKYC